jgi:hypothetical protein
MMQLLKKSQSTELQGTIGDKQSKHEKEKKK